MRYRRRRSSGSSGFDSGFKNLRRRRKRVRDASVRAGGDAGRRSLTRVDRIRAGGRARGGGRAAAAAPRGGGARSRRSAFRGDRGGGRGKRVFRGWFRVFFLLQEFLREGRGGRHSRRRSRRRGRRRRPRRARDAASADAPRDIPPRGEPRAPLRGDGGARPATILGRRDQRRQRQRRGGIRVESGRRASGCRRVLRREPSLGARALAPAAVAGAEFRVSAVAQGPLRGTSARRPSPSPGASRFFARGPRRERARTPGAARSRRRRPPPPPRPSPRPYSGSGSGRATTERRRATGRTRRYHRLPPPGRGPSRSRVRALRRRWPSRSRSRVPPRASPPSRR